MNPSSAEWADIYPRVAKAIVYLAEAAPRQPSLEEVAKVMAMSPSHAQRVFQRWAGVSAKRMSKALTWALARERLRAGANVLEAAGDAELSGPGRLHDLAVSLEAMTPGEASALGGGLIARMGVAWTPLGRALIAWSKRGIIAFRFIDDQGEAVLRAEVAAEWPGAAFDDDDDGAERLAAQMFRDAPPESPLHVLVRGTNFQVRVWRALLDIPAGQVVSYGDVARRIGQPSAVRAVGQAVGRNPIGWLIPCHRVLQSQGGLGGYRWGPDRKRAALVYEACRQSG